MFVLLYVFFFVVSLFFLRLIIQKITAHPMTVEIRSIGEGATFVQVGAQVSSRLWGGGDPLWRCIQRDKWKGLLVEPNPSAMKRLRRKYRKRSDIFFEECAVVKNKEGDTAPFYTTRFPLSWFDPCPSSSLSRAHFKKRTWYSDKMVTIEVKVKTLTELLNAYRDKFSHIDLLVLDIEGLESCIICSTDWNELNEIKPKYILYEYFHHSSAEQEVYSKVVDE
ncbi:MAG: FkbM family methyltransferase [Gemmatimonadota bacterium]|nr:FkbM family methyltransferase [Gemmatimonadota bacterium]